MLYARRMSLGIALFSALSTVQALYASELAFDGNNRILTVADAGGQIRGQILSTDGTPVTGVINYTTGPSINALAAVRYGGGRYLIAYTNVYSSSDTDIWGIFVRPDGTVEKQFHIDFSTARDDASRVVYVAERNEFYVVYMRRKASAVDNELRGVYVTSSGSTARGARLANDVRFEAAGSTSIAAGPGNIMVVYLDNAGTVRRGHIVPGETLFRESIFVGNAPRTIGVGNAKSAAYNPALSRFAVTYADGSSSTDSTVFIQTIPVSCFLSGCAGTSSANFALSTFEAGSMGISGHAVAAAGSNFVIAAGTRWSDRSGVLSASVNADGWAHTKHLGAWTTTCTSNSHWIVEAASLGANGLYVMAPPCKPQNTREGLTLQTWSGRVGVPFAIPIGK